MQSNRVSSYLLDTTLVYQDTGHILGCYRRVSQRSRNVLIERSRNVLLTDSDLDGRGQIRDEPERAGPAEGSARGEEGLDYAEAGERATEGHRAPNPSAVEEDAEGWRSGGGSWAARP